VKRLRLGIIGTGIAANDLYFPHFAKLRSRIEFVACANRRRSKAVAFAERAGIPRVHANGEALLRDPEVEAVLLSLPIHLNASWVMKALSAGKHVLCEKPIAATLEDGRRLVREAKKLEPVFMVGENYFFTPHIVKARDWVKRGALGEVRLVEAGQYWLTTPDNKYAKTPWRKRPKHLGGFVVDGGVHVANVVRETFGMPRSVRNLTALFNPRLPPIDTVVAAFSFDSGALGVWRSSYSTKSTREIPMVRAHGSRANLEIYYGYSVLEVHGRKPVRFESRENGFYHEFRHFASAALGREKLRFEPRAALEDLELMARIVR
jgi:predicted dehydrogenase